MSPEGQCNNRSSPHSPLARRVIVAGGGQCQHLPYCGFKWINPYASCSGLQFFFMQSSSRLATMYRMLTKRRSSPSARCAPGQQIAVRRPALARKPGHWAVSTRVERETRGSVMHMTSSGSAGPPATVGRRTILGKLLWWEAEALIAGHHRVPI